VYEAVQVLLVGDKPGREGNLHRISPATRALSFPKGAGSLQRPSGSQRGPLYFHAAS